MCFVAYVGTDKPIPRKAWDKEALDLSVKSLTDRAAPAEAGITTNGTSITIHMSLELAERSYIYLDYPRSVTDGGYFWAIDIPSFVKRLKTKPNQATESPSSPAITNGSCRITITNPSSLAHGVSVVTSDGSIIVKGSVPILNKRPPVWKMINAAVAGENIVITIDEKTTKLFVASDTAELVVDVGSSSQPVVQHPKIIQWR